MSRNKPLPQYKNKVALAALEILMSEIWEATLHIHLSSKDRKLSTRDKEDVVESWRNRISVVYRDLKKHLKKDKV